MRVTKKHFNCDQFSYTSKTSSVLINHQKKKHENIQQLDANDTLEKEDTEKSESSGNNSESDDDVETE